MDACRRGAGEGPALTDVTPRATFTSYERSKEKASGLHADQREASGDDPGARSQGGRTEAGRRGPCGGSRQGSPRARAGHERRRASRRHAPRRLRAAASSTVCVTSGASRPRRVGRHRVSRSRTMRCTRRLLVPSTEHQHDELVVPASVYAEILVGHTAREPKQLPRSKAFLADFAVRIEAMTPCDRPSGGASSRRDRSLRLPDALVLASGGRARGRQGAHRRRIMGQDQPPRDARPRR